MKILSIETSCDETGISIIEVKDSKESKSFNIIANQLHSQAELHKEYGGVYPDLAKREHSKNLPILLIQALQEARLYEEYNNPIDEDLQDSILTNMEKDLDFANDILDMLESMAIPKIDMIAVTAGPGLPPALWMGVNFAKALSLVWNIPIIPVNHMEGHILVGLLEQRGKDNTYDIINPQYPSLALLISGGHTEIVRFSILGKYEIIGETLDDAVGEAFDKVARMLGLSYPGGPEISRLAEYARKSQIIVRDEFRLPRPMLHSGDLNFSFSGLKTAVATIIKRISSLDDDMRCELALEFENAVTDVLVKKCEKAIFEYNAKSLVVGGGVSANTHIREQLGQLTQDESVDMYYPGRGLSTDNSIMIGIAAAMDKKPIAPNDLRAISSWRISEI